jgi:DNA-binding NtrC family response regulator
VLLVTELLRDVGFHVVQAKNGEEAISLYRNEYVAGRTFDAVILDIFVKHGIGAGETIPKLLEIDPAVKAIVSSGSHEHRLISHFADFGFKAAMPKPYTRAEAWQILSGVIKDGKESNNDECTGDRWSRLYR